MFTGSYVTNSFGLQILQGVHDLSSGGDTLKLALYDNTATLTNLTTVYTATGELATALGYTAGGVTATGKSTTLSGNYPIFTCDDFGWSPATFTARGALLYNASKGNKSIFVIDFGQDKIASGTFTVQIPTPDVNNGFLVLTLAIQTL